MSQAVLKTHYASLWERSLRVTLLFAFFALSFACNDFNVSSPAVNGARGFAGVSDAYINEEGYLTLNWSAAKGPFTVRVLASDTAPELMEELEDASPLAKKSFDFKGASEVLSLPVVSTVESGESFTWPEALVAGKYYTVEVHTASPRNRHYLLLKPNLAAASGLIVKDDDASGEKVLSWTATPGALDYQIETSTTALGTSSTTSFAISNYDETMAYSFCVRPRRGALVSTECSSIEIPAHASRAKALAVSSPLADGFYTTGSELTFEVTFSEAVTVPEGAEPLLILRAGDRRPLASYVSGSGSTVLRFRYVLQGGDDTSELDALRLIDGDGAGKIQDASGVTISHRLPIAGSNASLAELKDFKIDTVPPTLPGSPAFGGLTSASLSVNASWTASTDANLKNYESKTCATRDCSGTCDTSATGTVSSQNFMLTNGSTRYVCVRAHDEANNSSEWVASLNPIIVDTSAPSIVRVSSPNADGAYRADSSIAITLEFTEPVFVTNGNEFTLTLETGGTDQNATYVSGHGTNTLNFEYLVQAGDFSTDLDYVSVGALSLGTGGELRSSAVNPASTILPAQGHANSLALQKALIIDTMPPTNPASVGFAGTHSTSASLVVSWADSTDANLSTQQAKLCTSNDCATGCLAASNSSTSPLTLTGSHAATYYACVRATDLAGNSSSWIPSLSTTTVDTSIPAVLSVTSSTADGHYNTGDIVSVSVKFSEPVLLTNTSDITLLLETGTPDRSAPYTSDNGTDTVTFTYTVQAGDISADLAPHSTAALSVGASGTIEDAAGNNATLTLPPGALSSTNNLIIDTTNPADPTAVTFASSTIASSSFPMTFISSTDSNLKVHNVQICTAADCTTGCVSIGTQETSPAQMTGVSGTTYYGCVQGKDHAGNLSAWIPSGATITVDTTAPTVTNVTSTAADGHYKVGDSVPITVTFSESVMTTHSADIQLTLATGGIDRSLTLISGSGTNTLTFAYTVQSGDTSADLDLIVINPLTLGTSGTIKDAAGNNAVLSLAAPGAAGSISNQKAIVIDSTDPTAPGTVVFAGAFSNALTMPVSWVNSTDTNPIQYSVKTCTSSNCSTGCNAETAAAGTPASPAGLVGQTLFACVRSQDTAGNMSAWVSSAATIQVDTVVPSITQVTSDTANGYYNSGDTVSIAVQFSEMVEVSNPAAVTLALDIGAGQAASYASGTGTDTLLFNYTVQAGDTSADLEVLTTTPFDLAGETIKDRAGNNADLTAPALGGGSSLSGQKAIVLDDTVPAAPTAIAFADTHSTSTSLPLTWTNASDTNFLTHNIKLCTDNLCSTSCIADTTSPSTPKTLAGANGASYYACVQGEDRAGNKSAWIASAASVQVDTTIPTITKVYGSTANGYFNETDTLTLKVDFSENVYVSNPGDLDLLLETGGPDTSAAYSAGHGTSTLTFLYTVAASDISSDLNAQAITLGTGTLKDAAGNNVTLTLPTGVNSLAGQQSYIIDNTHPTAPAGVSFTNPLANSTTLNLTWTNSTDTNFKQHNAKICDAADCSNNCSAPVTANQSPASLIGVDGSSYYACVQGEDHAGNLSSWILSAGTGAVDTTDPTVTTVSATNANGAYKAGDVLTLTATFSEPVFYTNTSEISLWLSLGNPGHKALLSGGQGTTTLRFDYTIVATDTTADLDVFDDHALSLGNGTIKDAAGNSLDVLLPVAAEAGSLRTQKDIVVDTTNPTAPSSVGFAGAVSGSPSFNVLWSNGSDTNFSQNNVKACSSSDCATGCTATVNSVASPAIVSGTDGTTYYGCVRSEDTAGNTSAWVTSIGNTRVDTNPPTVTSVSASTADGYYNIGDTVNITVQFSEVVYLTNEASFGLTVETGTPDRVATYASGDASNTLTFAYTVAAGDTSSDLNLASASALSVGAGSIKDAGGTDADLTVSTAGGTSLAGQTAIIIDTTNPSAPSAVGFPGMTTSSTDFSMLWTTGTDTNFRYSNVKICTANDCSTGCTSAATSVASPKAMTGVAGTTYYGCVQSEDLAANTSVWVSSSAAINILAPPTFAGVASGEVLGSWSDGTAKVELTFAAVPPVNITKYRVFFHSTNIFANFDLNSPIATIDVGDSTYDSDPSDTKILVSRPATTLDDGYYVVRFYDSTGSFTDSNTAVSSAVYVLKDHPNYVLVPKKFSGLSYDYFIMRYEASMSSTGTFSASDVVDLDEADIAACSYDFHVNGTPAAATCGTRLSTAYAQSVPSVLPKGDSDFNTAFFACRNASDSAAKVRLPTVEEWRRAAQGYGASYTDYWDAVGSETAGNCNIRTGVVTNTGAAANCKTALGIYDMGGNLTEWADMRFKRYTISSAGESRFGYGPTIGRTIPNGIDNIVRRFHGYDPSGQTQAVLMGPSYAVNSLKPLGHDMQNIMSAEQYSPTIGYRCIGFRADTMPTMEQLALPDEPKFTAADVSTAAATNPVPENFFAKDARWETLAITVDGNTSDANAEGAVTLSWQPWSKTVCDSTGVCSGSGNGFTYHVYRFIEPNRHAIETVLPWALSGAGSSYSTDRPMDPLAVDTSGASLFSGSTNDGKIVATITNCNASSTAACMFTDSIWAGTGFSARQIYNYIIVAEDSEGNKVYPRVQTYHSRTRGPGFSGATTPFRLEARFRRAAVFLVDEAHQQAQTAPQIMVHVPMDKSGLDHDFFIYKYEAASHSGTVSNELPSGAPGSSSWPLSAAAGSWSWSENAGKCHEYFLKTGTFSTTYCGDGSIVNGTTTTLQSAQGVSPLVSIDSGASWKACRNTGITDLSGNAYYFRLASDPEWLKAADWGDVDHDGDIDQSIYAANIGTVITALESGAGDTTTVRCHTDSSPNAAYTTNNAATANCRSRYGAADMVGNYWELTSGTNYNAAGLDNGIDALQHGRGMPLGGLMSASTVGGYDFLRAYPVSGVSVPFYNGDELYGTSTTANELKRSVRGGRFGGGDQGRWSLASNDGAISLSNNSTLRCSH